MSPVFHLKNSISASASFVWLATPDAATLSCSSGTVNVSDVTVCTLVPSLNGATITAAAADFTLAVTGGTGSVSALTPAYGASLAFNFTASASATGPSEISNSVGGNNVTVIVVGM